MHWKKVLLSRELELLKEEIGAQIRRRTCDRQVHNSYRTYLKPSMVDRQKKHGVITGKVVASRNSLRSRFTITRSAFETVRGQLRGPGGPDTLIARRTVRHERGALPTSSPRPSDVRAGSWHLVSSTRSASQSGTQLSSCARSSKKHFDRWRHPTISKSDGGSWSLPRALAILARLAKKRIFSGICFIALRGGPSSLPLARAADYIPLLLDHFVATQIASAFQFGQEPSPESGGIFFPPTPWAWQYPANWTI